MYSSIYNNQLGFILIDSKERTYGEPMANPSSRGGRSGCGSRRGRGRDG